MKSFNEPCVQVVHNAHGLQPTLVGYFSDLILAKRVAAESGGRSILPVTAQFTIYDTYEEYQDNLYEEKRKNALAKLTQEEKTLLGL